MDTSLVTNKGGNFIDVETEVRKTDSASYREYFHKYADAELIAKEKDAGRLHALANRKKYTPERADI